jgi:acyl-CoA thioester hydrolase
MTPVSECEITIRVRYTECDPMGYLHHSQYLNYFEMGRTEMLRAGGIRYRDMEEQGVFFVVARAECRYRKPVRYDDQLTLRTRVLRQSRARIDHEYKLFRDGILLCEGSTTLACVDRAGQVRPIPDAMRPPAGDRAD